MIQSVISAITHEVKTLNNSLLAQLHTPSEIPDWLVYAGVSMTTHSTILAWRIPMEGGAWQTTVHEIAKSWTRLSS